MSNQLLFEPRRARVWAAKGAVVLLAGLVVAGVCSAGTGAVCGGSPSTVASRCATGPSREGTGRPGG